MAMSKTTSTYNRQNWEDSVSLKHKSNIQWTSINIFFVTGISDSLSNLPR